QVTAGPDGSFVTRRQYDGSSHAGIWHVTAKGVTSQLTNTADLFLGRLTLANNNDSGNPAVRAGTSVSLSLSGSGFGVPGAGSEAVRITSEPAGLFSEVDPQSDTNGNVSQTLLTNPAAPAGAYSVVAVGATSQFRLSVPFNVLSATATPSQLHAGDHPVINLSAAGFTPGARVTVSGGPFGAVAPIADSNGQVSIQEPVVATDPGIYTVT